jgi:hypothetical protein
MLYEAPIDLLINVIRGAADALHAARRLGSIVVDDDQVWINEILPHLNTAQAVCVECGLSDSLTLLVEQAQDLTKRVGAGFAAKTRDDVAESVRVLSLVLDDELKRITFLYLTPENLSDLNNTAGFGVAVADAFPSASEDIKQCLRCYALGCWTASGFHAVCALEPVLAALARRTGVACPWNAEWQPALTSINAKLLAAQQMTKTDPAKQAELTLWSNAAKHFGAVKDAHRNPMMHARENLDEGRAFSVRQHVQEFMQHLAVSGLRETP